MRPITTKTTAEYIKTFDSNGMKNIALKILNEWENNWMDQKAVSYIVNIVNNNQFIAKI